MKHVVFFVCLVLLLPGLALGTTYQHDDGVAENAIGLSGPGTIWWGNVFDTGGTTQTITTLQVAFSSTAVLNHDFDLFLLSDDDGDPTSGATVLQTVAGTVQFDDDTFQTYSISATDVTGYFVVAATATSNQSGMYFAALDDTSSQGMSWVATGSTGGLPTGTSGKVDSFGFPGNFLLRAEATDAAPVPEPVSLSALLMGAGGLVGYLRRRRS